MKRHLTILTLLLAAILLLTACGGGGGATVKPTEELTGGDSMENAQKIAVNTKYHGKYEEGEVWFSFKTGEQEDVKYSVALTNLSADGHDLEVYLYEVPETYVKPDSRTDGARWPEATAIATPNGRSCTGVFHELKPNMTYSLVLRGKGKSKYSLLIIDPSQEIAYLPEQPAIEDVESYYTADNMDEAPSLTANTRYQSKYIEGFDWVAFKTGDQEDVPYRIIVDNLTAGSSDLEIYLHDEFGNHIVPDTRTDGVHWPEAATVSKQTGRVCTGIFNSLQPDSTYYLAIQGKSKAEYSIRIEDPNLEAFDIAAGRNTVSGNDDYETATNQDGAPLLLLNTPYHSKYVEGFNWVAFKTGEQEDVVYSITTENLSINSKDLEVYLYDGYGTHIKPDSRNDGEHWPEAATVSKQSGRACTGTFNSLEPDTIYYLAIQGGSKAEYTLRINDPTQTPEFESGSGVESFLNGVDETIVPGTSQSSALNLPLGTKVFGKYVDGYAWVSFTTADVEDAVYYVTMVNASVGSKNLEAFLHDEYGTHLKPNSRNDGERWPEAATVGQQNGRACTGTYTGLKPNSTYYLAIQGEGKAEYSLLISTPAQSSTAYATHSNIAEAMGALSEEDELYTGTNQNIATKLKTNTRYKGRYIDGFCWVSFTTGDQEDVPYTVTLENLTVNSQDLEVYLHDEYGTHLIPDSRNDGEHWPKAAAVAKQDGRACTGTFNSLLPNTTYYLAIQGKSKADYILLIGEPTEQPEGNTIATEPEPIEEVVFEVPFELNETQVRFVADQAAFIDEAEAKAALEPVAKVILEHPGHAILLAGTTATFGDQAACVTLSNARAEAVKNMLVNTFGVPADQLLTVGLGYQNDPFVRGKDVDSNGNFIRTEAAKNRRVIVMDAETDIAKQVLGN